jgi:hypothetical protein
MEPLTIDVSGVTGGQFVVSLPILTPPPRYDGVPWSEVIVEEGPANDGPWTELATDPIPLTSTYYPLPYPEKEALATAIDHDPTQPGPRGFTIIGATIEKGWYRVTWVDANGGRRPVDPYSMGDNRLPPTPALEEVAALMRAHVADIDDNSLQTFTDTTNPPADQVRVIIETVRQEVATRLRSDVPTAYMDSARYVVAIGTVSYIESSARPDPEKPSPVRPIYLGRLSDLQEACNEAYVRRLH